MQEFSARLKFKIEDIRTGQHIVAHERTLKNLRHTTGLIDRLVEAGEMVIIDVAGKLEAYTTETDPTLLVLATDTPGLCYCLASDLPHHDKLGRCGAFLLTGNETIREQDFEATPTPVWAGGGNWLDHQHVVDTSNQRDPYPDILRTDLKDDLPIGCGGSTLWIPPNPDGAGTQQRAANRFVWGRTNKINLGDTDNDCTVFDFWYRKPGAGHTLNTAFLKFGSYPYTDQTREEDLADTDGDGNDTTYLNQSVPPGDPLPSGASENLGAYFHFDLDTYTGAHLNSDWVHFQLRKRDFSKVQSGGEDPDWTRITWMEFYDHTQNLSSGSYASAIAVVGEGAGWRKLDLCAIEMLRWASTGGYPEARRTTGAYLILHGPPSHNARVQGFIGVV